MDFSSALFSAILVFLSILLFFFIRVFFFCRSILFIHHLTFSRLIYKAEIIDSDYCSLLATVLGMSRLCMLTTISTMKVGLIMFYLKRVDRRGDRVELIYCWSVVYVPTV